MFLQYSTGCLSEPQYEQTIVIIPYMKFTIDNFVYNNITCSIFFTERTGQCLIEPSHSTPVHQKR